MSEGIELIKKYFPELSSVAYQKIEELQDLYAFWNEKINVISRKDMPNFYTHHVLHSLTIAAYFQFNKSHRIMDVGTGGGFPGIPLAILFPETSFLLVDSIQKKTQVVQQVCDALQLKNVEVKNNRAENIKGSYHYVVSRAVTRLQNFMPWIHASVLWEESNSGVLYLKGGEVQEEIAEISSYNVNVYHLKERFFESFFETKKLLHIFK